MLVGAIKGVEEPFELHYKLPDDKRQIAGREQPFYIALMIYGTR